MRLNAAVVVHITTDNAVPQGYSTPGDPRRTQSYPPGFALQINADELLNILAAIGAAVRTIVITADRELAQLRRERDSARPCPGATRPANAVRAQQIQPFAGTHPASTRAAKENPR